ncbi:MAG: hypothetical protein DRO18_02980, partial [Thermoprotei archaeon]
MSGAFWVTVDGSNWGPAISTSTISGSYLNISFDPDCTYSVGVQKWKGGVYESSFYYAGNSSEYVLTIYSELYPVINIPDGEAYPRGEKVNISGDVQDDCSYVSGASVVYKVRQGGSEYTAFSPQDLGNGTYRSYWDSTGAPLGWYNITMNVSKDYYNPAFTIKQNAFYLGARAELRNPFVDTVQDGWGHNYTFKIEFRDVEGDVNNITLWYSNSSSGPWKLIGWKTKVATAFENVTFYHIFTCEDYLNGPVIYYKFRAVDENNFVNETPVQSITLEQDDIDFVIEQGAGASVDREGTNPYRFIVRINDTDYGDWVGSGVQGTFYFTYDGANYDTGHSSQTNATGHIYFDFDPDCTYSVGLQLWYLSISGNACYKDKDMPTSTYSIIGQLKNNLVEPYYGAEFNVTDQILIRLNISTDCANEGLIDDASVSISLIHNATAAEYTCSPVNNENNGYYNCTWDSTGKPEGNYTIKLVSSRSSYNDNTTYLLNWIWLENRPPTYSNAFVTPDSGGWGEKYTYNVTIYDPEGDTITCKLYVNTTSGYVYKGSYTITGTPGTPTQGNCSVVVSDFSCNEQGLAHFVWQIEDGTASNTFNTSEFAGPTLGKDDVIVEYFAGNSSKVNRNGLNYTALILRIKDIDRNVYVESNGTVWIYKGANYFTWTNRSNATGHLVVNFNPDCSYDVGEWYWIGGSRNDACYKDVNSSKSFVVYVIGELEANVIQPDGEEYLRGTNITIRLNLSDECSSLVPGANLNISMISKSYSTVYYCSPIFDENTGYYNCTFNTSSFETQWYDIVVNSSKVYYNNGSYVKENAFWIETSPILFAPQVIPEVGGWGETFTLKVNVTDEDYDYVTVKCEKRKIGTDSWSSCGSTTKQGINQQAVFTTTFSSADIGDWVVRFTATEDDIWNDTVEKNFTVEKDDVVIVYVEGNETVVDRVSGSVTFRLRAEDADNPSQDISYQPAGFWVTVDGSTWGPLISTTTDALGNFTIDFDPDCTYSVGRQKWKGGLLSNPYWKEANSTEFNVTITSQFKAYITKPIGEIFLRGVDDIPLKGNLTDKAGCGGVAGGSVSFFTDTGYECVASDLGDGNYTCTIPAATAGAWSYGWHSLTINATREYYTGENASVAHAFYLADDPSLDNPSVDPTSGPWGTTFNFTITLTDLDPDNVTVYFWIRRPGQDWMLVDTYTYVGATPGTGAEIKFQLNSTCADVGTVEFKFNATDTSGYTAENPGGSFTVQEHGALLIVESGTDEEVNREGSDTVFFRVRVRDQTTGTYVGSGVNGSIWIESKVGYFTESLVTNETGYFNYIFDPDCNFRYGVVNWTIGVANDACYVDTNYTSTITIYGQLKNNLYLPGYGSVFNVTDSVLIRFNVSTDCIDEGLIANASTSVELIAPSGSIFVCEPVLNETGANAGWYNCTWDSTDMEEGYWDVRLNSSKEYFLDNSTTYMD